jgi:hypothetical protein
MYLVINLRNTYFGCFILLLGIVLIFDGLFLLVPIFVIIYLWTSSIDYTVVVRNKTKIKAIYLYFKLCRSGKLNRLSGSFTSISYLTIIVHLRNTYFGCFILLLGIVLIFDGLFLLVPIFVIIYLWTSSMRQLTMI